MRFILLLAAWLATTCHATQVTIDGTPAGDGSPDFILNNYATDVGYPIFHFEISRADLGSFDINNLELYAPVGPGAVYELEGYRTGITGPAVSYTVLPPPVYPGSGPRWLSLSDFTDLSRFMITVSSDIFFVNQVDVSVADVPEPATLALACIGLAGLLGGRRHYC